MQTADNRVEAFLAAGHVCTITGFDSYEHFVARFKVPVVVTGFEPIDLLEGILDCVQQLETNRAELTNQYARSVRPQGNLAAQDLVNRVYQTCDQPWRGMGVIPRGGSQLRDEFAKYDAMKRFGVTPAADRLPVIDDSECPAGDVLSGRMRPNKCPHFAARCTPDSPLGAPMVSSEGACAAYFRYQGVPR